MSFVTPQLSINEPTLVCPGKSERVTIWVRFMTKLETSPLSHITFRQTLARGLGDPINGLYSRPMRPLLCRKRLAFVKCTNTGCIHTAGILTALLELVPTLPWEAQYLPYNDLLADMSLNYSALTIFIINGTSSFTSQSIGKSPRSASYLILIGTICAFWHS